MHGAHQGNRRIRTCQDPQQVTYESRGVSASAPESAFLYWQTGEVEPALAYRLEIGRVQGQAALAFAPLPRELVRQRSDVARNSICICTRLHGCHGWST
jgi:hypothetical protein